ncbi:hypothetical protein ABEU79_15430, partial [Geobacillus thermodenitrificans]|uniref:hypothetical protein n=1 Tax=Geobacillus thermodenitrificans TaxID=33940 RepID=UPI003D1D4BFC
ESALAWGFSFRMVGRTFILQEIRQARAIFYACLILSSTTGVVYFLSYSHREDTNYHKGQ